MMRNLMLAVLAIGCIAALSGASQPSASQPTQVPGAEAAGPTLAASLRRVRMQGAFLHVDADFLRTQDGGTVRTVPISLKDGETTIVSVPGYPEQSFRFVRNNDDVTVGISTSLNLIARIFG